MSILECALCRKEEKPLHAYYTTVKASDGRDVACKALLCRACYEEMTNKTEKVSMGIKKSES